jgi:hypothetical protein
VIHQLGVDRTPLKIGSPAMAAEFIGIVDDWKLEQRKPTRPVAFLPRPFLKDFSAFIGPPQRARRLFERRR